MHTYVIGDVQGCYITLRALLKKIAFDDRQDQLWFVGDLVNRGADSLAVLRFVRDLGERAIVVLGNHDLHLLAIAAGIAKTKAGDTLAETLAAPDCDDLLTWLRHRPLLHCGREAAMVHAGLHPAWDWPRAQALAREIESALRGSDYRTLLGNMYGDEPSVWRDDLETVARLRLAMNVMTRMRVITASGALNLKFKGGVDQIPATQRPWFDVETARKPAPLLLVGHWSALGLRVSDAFVALDTGCLWGRELTAYRLRDGKIFSQPSVELQPTRD